MISNFQQCVFQVCYPKSYSALKKYKQHLDELEIKASGNSAKKSQDNSDNDSKKVIHHESNEVAQLKERMEREIQQNELEALRNYGKPVTYGSSIQLLHVQTQSFLTVARESAEMQKDCLRLSLDDVGSKYSHFSLLPYFNYRRDGEIVKLSDKIRIWNRKSAQYVQFSYYRYSNAVESGLKNAQSIGSNVNEMDKSSYTQLAKEAVKNNANLKKFTYDNRREVNMSASSAFSHWNLRVFSPCKDSPTESNKFLKAGDIIRIYHKEFDGFLTVNEKTGRVKLKKSFINPLIGSSANGEASFSNSGLSSMKGSGMKSFSSKSSLVSGQYSSSFNLADSFSLSSKSSLSLVDSSENTLSGVIQDDFDVTCHTLWQVEMLDSTKGGELRKNFVYRLRHVSTGNYLIARMATDDEEKKERDAEDAEISEFSHSSFYISSESSSSSIQLHNTTSPLSKTPIKTKKENNLSLFVEPQDNCTNPLNMLFNLQDSMLSTDHSEFFLNGQFRLRHYLTNTWLHSVNSQKAFSKSSERASLKSHYSPVCTTQGMREEDVLTCVLVSRPESEDLFTVQSYIPILKYFTQKLNDGSVNRSDIKLYIDVISSCIRFCTSSSEMDPLLRSGIPIKKNQKLMREKGVITIVMDILMALISKNYVKLEELSTIQERSDKIDFFDVIQYSYRFIRQVVLTNESNGLFMAQYINFIQTNIEHSISASEALLQILSNNFSLLNKITEDQIDFFIKLLFTNPTSSSSLKQHTERYGGSLKKAVYLSFLTSLIICEGKTVVKNQKYISNLLFSTFKEQMLKVFVIPRIRKSDDKVIIDVNRVEYELVNFSKSATNIDHITYSKNNFELMVFFQEQIKLFAAMCTGSNEATEMTRAAIIQLFTFEIVYKCVAESALTPALRTSFVHLLMHCFVDTEKNEKRTFIELTRKLESLSGKSVHEYTSRELGEVKQFLEVFFRENTSLDIGYEKRDVNNFILSLAQLCAGMIEFGIFNLKDFEETDLLVSLFNILRSDNDTKNGLPLRDEERFKQSEENVTVTQIKIEIAKIFHMLLDLLLDKRITKFLQFFWMKYKIDDIKIVIEEESDSLLGVTSNDKQQAQLLNLRKKELDRIFQEMDTKENQVLKDIFENTTLPFKIMSEFSLKIINLTSYENQELSTICLRLLIRRYRAADELAEALPKVELIVSREMARSYDHLRKQTADLRSIFGYGRSNFLGARHISEYEVKKAMKALGEVISDIKTNGKRSQRIIRNLNLFELVLSVLRKEWMVPTDIQENCLTILTEFVRGNPDNQKLLFPYIEFFMRLITENKKLSKYIVLLMCEIVKNNRTLCSILEEKLIEQYFDLIAEQRSAFMLLFLRTILATHNNTPIKRNQSLITKYMVERKKDVCVLFKDEEGMRERNNRITKEEHKTEPDGILNYHIALLHLMATAADGKNRESELRLQTLFSFEELLEQVVSPFTLAMIRNPLIKIINEVYINVEKATDDHQEKKTANVHHPLMYKMFSKMIRELEFVEMLQTLDVNAIVGSEGATNSPSPSGTGASLSASSATKLSNASVRPSMNLTNQALIRQSRAITNRNSSIAPKMQVTEEDLEKFHVDNYYIFEVMIPVVQNYFHLHFPPPNLLKEQLDVAEDLLLKLIDLHKFTANTDQREQIYKCITAMWKKSMSSESQLAITKFVTNKNTKAKMTRSRFEVSSTVETDEYIHKSYTKYLQKRIINKVEEFSHFNRIGALFEKYNGFVKVLVRALRKINTPLLNYSPSLLEVGLLSMEILKDIVRSQNKRAKEVKQKGENDVPEIENLNYVENKLPVMIIELMTSFNPAIVRSAIDLGILILNRGDKAIQDEFYRILTETDSSYFFESLRDRIRLGKTEIKERKNYLKKKRDKDYALFKQRQRQEVAKVRAKDENDSSRPMEEEEERDLQEDFVEMGHIELLFEFLRLLCEGHNVEMQTLLLNQPVNTLNVNVVTETIEYMIALEKKIDFDNVQIAIQGFKTLTEFIQGPALVIQQAIGTSPRFYARLVNEIMSKTYEDGNLLKQQELGLKREVLLTLNALLEGMNNSVFDFMRHSLNFDELEHFLLFSARFLHSLETKHENSDAKDEYNEIKQRLRRDFDHHFLHEATRDKANPVIAEDYIAVYMPMIKNLLKETGNFAFFLLNIFRDGERENLRNISRSAFISVEEENKLLRITNMLDNHSQLVSVFSESTASIEVLRDNKIEKIYFSKPTICNNLMDKARSNYVNSLDVMAPEEKVRTLYNHTFSIFQVEMEHYELMKKKSTIKDKLEDLVGIANKHTEEVTEFVPTMAQLRNKYKRKKKLSIGTSSKNRDQTASWEFIAHWWDRIRLLSFIFCVVLNIFVLGFLKRLYSANTVDDIPVPGDLDFDITLASKYPTTRNLAGDIIITILGAIQLITTASLAIIYAKVFITLEVKKRFKLKKREKWENIPRNREFYWKFIFYALQDLQMWFFVLYFVLSVLGLLISPIVYSIQLFEIVFRFKSLNDVLRAVISNGKKLFFAGMLLGITMFLFGLLFFSWFSNDFTLESNGTKTCESVLECFVTMFDYGFRSESSWENMYPHNPTVGRAILDLAFNMIVIVYLSNVVFGTILDSFQELRAAREERKNEIREKCFICALEKSKFDTKANEGITFEKHIKEEHYLWNYVYFLIYLYEKPETEYTGVESYIFEKCEENDDVTSFFPIFRSKTIEESEQTKVSLGGSD
ncbi:predicted protein [Naegleria gruberi]|uniref:Predicted protein n=1 Tax=Naegleria gruberi TaxID=5762 RepID=D2VLG5_NAEGR|nr:uncharacterized protein NAEGRDRAFT_50531 [Naegleria gruberi]EFC42308.1 predicted protein [Naegleria gruberi]|eukprot:XP_002675052.1 predicted protein [Naegleria gruberi strain NEG-M]